MKLLVQTNIFNPVVAYDTTSTAPPSGFKKMLMDFLKPVAQLQDDSGTVLYKTGDFYPAVGQYFIAGFVGILAVGTVIILTRNSRNKNAKR